ncbi:MAG TPA: hypothetical protein VNB23_07830 [Ramlibacter sp.]|nr:hypothetical protein [Ramlibacter sp.]
MSGQTAGTVRTQPQYPAPLPQAPALAAEGEVPTPAPVASPVFGFAFGIPLRAEGGK